MRYSQLYVGTARKHKRQQYYFRSRLCKVNEIYIHISLVSVTRKFIIVQRQRRQSQFHQQQKAWHHASFKRVQPFKGILFQPFIKTRWKTWKKTEFAEEKNNFSPRQVPPHKRVLPMEKLRDLCYELLEHPPYSPDLALSDLHLFPKLKTLSRWSTFFIRSRGDFSCRQVFCRSYTKTTSGTG